MNSLLGLNDDLLQQAGAVERAGYYSATRLFLLVAVLSFVSNGYFGYLFLGTAWGALLVAVLVGFIHFSVLRISLITLMTKPLVEKKKGEPRVSASNTFAQPITADSPDALPSPAVPANGSTKVGVKSIGIRRLNFSSVMRFVFVGLIAVTICIPLSTLFFHNEAMRIEEAYRNTLLNQYSTGTAQLQISAGPINHQLEEAHYPFVIFETLWLQRTYRLVVLVFLIIVYLPLFALARLRYGKNYRYADLCRESMRKEILFDYQETLEQSQVFLNSNFPAFKKKLTELTAFSDPPFKYQPRNAANRKTGTTDEFRQFMSTR